MPCATCEQPHLDLAAAELPLVAPPQRSICRALANLILGNRSIAIVKKRANLPHSLYQLLQILSLTMFETTQ
jgi:hypothetical protein